VRDLEAASRVEQLENAGAEGQLGSFIAMSGPRGLDADEIAARTGATGKQIEALAKGLVSAGRAVEVSSNPLMLISAEVQKALAAQVVNLLEDRHRRDPLSLGLSREEVRERIFSHARPEVFRSIVRGLVDAGKLAAERDTLRLASHRPEMSGAEAEARHRMEAAIDAAGLQAATLDEIAASTGTSIQLARKLFTLLVAEGRVLRIGDFVFAAAALEDLKARVRARRQIGPRMDVAVFKQITGGLSRKYAIPLLEYLDREGLTRRIGNEREIL
jgi:selenocysteine-specific elongation factor